MDKIREFLLKLNEKGIPLPLLYDNVRKKGSLTMTMYWISFQLCIVGLVGKWTDKLNIDYTNCIWLLGVTGGFYLGRSITTAKGGSVGGGTTPPAETPSEPEQPN